MLHHNQSDWYSNESYQRSLADNLIKSLGHDNAISACNEHGWLETLKFVQCDRSDGLTPLSGPPLKLETGAV